MGSVRVSYYCVPFLLGKPRVKNTFVKSFSQKNAPSDRIVNLKHSNLDLIQRIQTRCGFDGFMIRFWIGLRNAPSVKLLAKYAIEDSRHPSGPKPWTSWGTWSIDYPRGRPLIFEDKFLTFFFLNAIHGFELSDVLLMYWPRRFFFLT